MKSKFTGKRYKIETINDILSAINEDNKDKFLMNMYEFLNEYLEVKKRNPGARVRTSGFVWVDDGKVNIEYTEIKE